MTGKPRPRHLQKVYPNRLIIQTEDGRQYVWEFEEFKQMTVNRGFDMGRSKGSELVFVRPLNHHQISMKIDEAEFRHDLSNSHAELGETLSGTYHADIKSTIFWVCGRCFSPNMEELTIGNIGPQHCCMCGRVEDQEKCHALPRHPGLLIGNNEHLRMTPEAFKVLCKAAKGVSAENAYKMWMDFFQALEVEKSDDQ